MVIALNEQVIEIAEGGFDRSAQSRPTSIGRLRTFVQPEKKFTQPQLFACLVLKSFLKTDYRGVVAFLHDCPELARAIGLDQIPHFTTLQKAGRRLLKLGNV